MAGKWFEVVECLKGGGPAGASKMPVAEASKAATEASSRYPEALAYSGGPPVAASAAYRA